jgi:hypothetical protein
MRLLRESGVEGEESMGARISALTDVVKGGFSCMTRRHEEGRG